MNPAEIDQILRSDDAIEPSARLHSQVMHAVRGHAAVGQRRKRGFGEVWRVAAVAAVVVPLLIAVRLLEGLELQPGSAMEAGRWLSFTLTATLAGASWVMHDAI